MQAIAKQDLDKVDHEEASCIVNESDVSSPLETEFKSEDQDAVVKNQEQASKEWEELQRYLTRSSNRDLSTLKKAVTIRLQHVLDAAIHRIDDLLVNQEVLLCMSVLFSLAHICALQRLLDNVNALGNSFIGNDEIEAIEKTMAKLPKYTQKIENIQKAMSTISESIEKLKCRSESLRIDAQSCKYFCKFYLS